jgi:hypothetical protein
MLSSFPLSPSVVREERRERRRGPQAAAAVVGGGEVMGLVWEVAAVGGG